LGNGSDGTFFAHKKEPKRDLVGCASADCPNFLFSQEDQVSQENTIMRCILGMCVVLAMASSAWATENIVTSTDPLQDPAVSTPVPNIHSPGAPAVTTPAPSSAYQVPAPAPTA